MVSIKEVLAKVSAGKTVEDASKELNMREPTLRAMIDFMVEKGYLGEFEGGAGCAGCSLRGKCKVPLPGEQRFKMYVLTGQGREYLHLG